MSSIEEMVADLVASGTAPGIAARVVTEAFAAGIASVTLSSRYASRSVALEQARVRAQNFRNRKKLQRVAKANDVATTTETVAAPAVMRNVTPPAKPLNSILLESLPFGKEEESKREVVARARGRRLKSGEPLLPEFVDVALAEGMAPDRVQQVWTEFVDYWSDIPGHRGIKISWRGTWRNNVKRVLGFGQRSNLNNGRRTIHAAAKDLTQQLLAELDQPAPGSLCEPEGGGAFRLLPTR